MRLAIDEPVRPPARKGLREIAPIPPRRASARPPLEQRPWQLTTPFPRRPERCSGRSHQFHLGGFELPHPAFFASENDSKDLGPVSARKPVQGRSEEHTSEL